MESAVVRRSLHLQGFAPERMEEIIRGGRFEHYILSRTECEVRHERWECGGFSVDAASYSFAARACGALARDRLCIGYIRGHTEPTWINGFECGMEAIQFYPPGCEINYRAGPGGSWVAIEFDEASLQQAARERLGHELDLPRGGARNLMVPRAARQALERMVDLSLRQTQASASMIGPIMGSLAALLSHAQTGGMETLARRWRHREALLAKAEQFLRANLGRPFDGKALARAVGATERSVQKHFFEAYGMSPGQWTRCLVLHHARKRLLETDPARFTVEGIAHELGIRHMGRFAGHYKDLFGEYPSATLAKLQ
jgi:AraC family transcriptional regulator, ethanolamine operon transcriptional activator